MVLVRVHAAIGEQAEEMQTPLADAGASHRVEQDGICEKNSPFSIMRSILVMSM